MREDQKRRWTEAARQKHVAEGRNYPPVSSPSFLVLASCFYIYREFTWRSLVARCTSQMRKRMLCVRLAYPKIIDHTNSR